MPGNKKKTEFLVKSACFLVFVLFLAGVAGCAGSGSMDAVAESPPAAPEMGRDMADSGFSMASSANQAAFEEMEVKGSAGEAAVNQTQENSGRRYMVQRSSLTLEIADLEEAAESIRAGVEQMGGYVASLNFYDLTRERRRGQISLRVPEEKYTRAILWLQEQGEVKNIEESAEDVTMRYIDLEARIANLQAQEQRIRELLEKATDIENILQIEKELTRIRGIWSPCRASLNICGRGLPFPLLMFTWRKKIPGSLPWLVNSALLGKSCPSVFPLIPTVS